MLYAIVAMLAVIVDQWVKYWIAGHIPFETGIIRLVPGVLSLVNIHNDGAAFSFLSGGGARIWFILICGVFTLLVIIALATNMISGKVGRWSAVMVAAGGIGNCIDRILYGYVQDMFKVELFNFAVFNVADIFITLFCIIFILYVIFGTRGSDDEDEEDEEEEEEPVEEKPSRKERKAAAKAAKAEEKEKKAELKETRVRPEPLPKSRKAEQDKYEDDFRKYEEKKRADAARKSAAKAPVKPAVVKSTVSSEEMADFENATKRFETPKRTAAPVVEKPAAPEAPKAAPKPAPKPAAKPVVEEDLDFDLESILNEFK